MAFVDVDSQLLSSSLHKNISYDLPGMANVSFLRSSFKIIILFLLFPFSLIFFIVSFPHSFPLHVFLLIFLACFPPFLHFLLISFPFFLPLNHVSNSGPRAKFGSICNQNWPARSYQTRIRAVLRLVSVILYIFYSNSISRVFVISRFSCSRFCV